MAKTNDIQKFVNGEIIDANPVNQVIENAGAEGGLIPYDDDTNQRDTSGKESLGNTLYPWGDLCLNQNAYLREIETTNQSESASIQIKNLRKFITLKDVDDTDYSGKANYVPKVNSTEDGVELVDPETFVDNNKDATFSAKRATSTQSVGNASTENIIFNSENFDTGADYNTSTGTFTAPETGYYLVNAIIYYTVSTINGWDGYIALGSNGSSHVRIFTASSVAQGESGIVSGSAILYLTAGQTAEVIVNAASDRYVDILVDSLFTGMILT